MFLIAKSLIAHSLINKLSLFKNIQPLILSYTLFFANKFAEEDEKTDVNLIAFNIILNQ